MSRFQCSFQSKALLVPATITVTLPFPVFDPASSDQTLDVIYVSKEKFKTPYPFHGTFSDSNSWFLHSRVDEYVDRHGLVLVMPSVGNSFYADLLHSPAYWTFVSEKLPRLTRSVLALSDKRENSFIAGLSMGGYGAFKLALNQPEKFAAGISIFGVLDIVTIIKNRIHAVFNMNEYFGCFDRLRDSSSDLFAQLQHLKQQGVSIPSLYMAYGLEDPLYEINVKFRDFAISHSVDLIYEEGPGAHTWDFCDPYVCRALDWLSTVQ